MPDTNAFSSQDTGTTRHMPPLPPSDSVSVITMNRLGINQTSPIPKAAFFLWVAALCLGCLPGCSKPEQPVRLVSKSRIALLKSDFKEVERLAALMPNDARQKQQVLLIAGEACAKDDRLEDAVTYYRDAESLDADSEDGRLAVFSIAEIRLQQCRLTDAERRYQQIYDVQPGNIVVNERLAFLLSLTGRRWDALKHYFGLIQSGDASFRELSLAADVGRAIEQPEFLARCLEQNPDEVLVRLAVAYRRAEDGHLDVADELRSILAVEPNLLGAQALLGSQLFDLKADGSFVAWHSSLPKGANSSPDIWYVRGLWARRAGHPDVAVNCFLHAVRRSVFHRESFYALGQTLSQLKASNAEAVVKHASKLTLLTQRIDEVLTSEAADLPALQECTELVESLGRTWEACAWAVIGRQQAPGAEWHEQILQKHAQRLTQELPWVEPGFNPTEDMDVSDFDFDLWLQNAAKNISDERPAGKSLAAVRFDHVSGVPFQYDNSEDLRTPGMRMFEQTGGGVGILDLDSNGSPDVYLPQGCPWQTGSDCPTPDPAVKDTLFRIRQGASAELMGIEAFEDVSDVIPSGTTGFGQGCAVGDFNDDGIDDIYVANVGQNRLLEGMGDGTFTDVTALAGLQDDSWTVSVMVCDLNADGLPDLFDVNYVEGEDVYQMICNGKSCSPKAFAGAADRIWMNLGDGSFDQVDPPVSSSMAKGLGIAAFETSTRRRPVVFVANDQVANFFLTNNPADNQHNLTMSNSAMVTGLAFNENGLAMACMGIAVDDFDSNNLLDLFVTNFKDEPNTLYLQEAVGVFQDSTRPAGLYAGGLPMTGWGVQPLDADLDGRPDLVVANGHVDDYTDVGGPFRMKPHFYHQQPERFEQLSADRVGEWFDGEYLGRGLARVDWNMDGRPEFITSLVNQPVAVMLNRTVDAGHYLKFKLKASLTARDAIGARVRVISGETTRTRQLLAGDGYMASNERIVTFGLGATTVIDSVVIDWPSGSRSVIFEPHVDQFYFVTEGVKSATAFEANRYRSLTIGAFAPEALQPNADASGGGVSAFHLAEAVR